MLFRIDVIFKVKFQAMHLLYYVQRSDFTFDPLSQGTLMTFDQTEFFGGAFANIGLDDEGYIFVPNQCADRSVRKLLSHWFGFAG